MLKSKEFFMGGFFFLLLFAAAAGGAAWVRAQGSLTPPGPPEPVMRTLDQVYAAASGNVDEREGYARSFNIASGATETLLTVPAVKTLVLLKLYAYNSDDTKWNMTLDDQPFLDGRINKFDSSTCRFAHDFPDRCVAIEAGKTLKVTSVSGDTVIALIGYYY